MYEKVDIEVVTINILEKVKLFYVFNPHHRIYLLIFLREKHQSVYPPQHPPTHALPGSNPQPRFVPRPGGGVNPHSLSV